MAIAKPITIIKYESRVPIALQLNNKGLSALENIIVSFRVSKDCAANFFEENEKYTIPHLLPKQLNGSISIADSQKEFSFYLGMLNPDSVYPFDLVYLLAPYEATDFEIHWTIKSKTYQNSGILQIKSEPEYIDSWIESTEKAGTTISGEITTEE